MKHVLEFEKPVVNLKDKISELKKMTSDSEIDLTDEIAIMEQRLANLENDIYGNLKPWERVQMARHPERPTSLDYISEIFEDFIEFHGDRYFGDDEALVAGVAFYKSKPVTVIGHQRGKNTKENLKRNFGMPHPEGYRKALRHMKLAEKFHRPIICFIDTKGADPGKESEERGQSEAIANNLLQMAGLTVPIICVVIGEGGSGGALAIGVGDRVYMLENATYSVISPEGAAALLWKDSGQAKRAAETMQITSYDLKKLEIIDGIIKEPKGGAHRDIQQQAANIDKVLDKTLTELSKMSPDELLDKRWDKYKCMGAFATMGD
ncbi:acetyl-CoA carboxylase carboxyl transferase subunit alpha [Virgibacillus halophilus]|uniref:acetyl-CoA carboxylase carboxyl transferase subunit alpha n=1 Tax=Tigheibacillus halophilus TaxID=361280 RepID=UPI0036347C4E